MSKKDKLITVVNALVTRLEKAESFALEQAPDVCKEIIAEKTALCVYTVAGLGAISFLSLVLAILAWKLLSHESSSYDPCSAASGWAFICSALSLGFTIASANNAMELISLKTAPKLTILRELRRLVK